MLLCRIMWFHGRATDKGRLLLRSGNRLIEPICRSTILMSLKTVVIMLRIPFPEGKI